jgi:hypothetical protein
MLPRLHAHPPHHTVGRIDGSCNRCGGSSSRSHVRLFNHTAATAAEVMLHCAWYAAGLYPKPSLQQHHLLLQANRAACTLVRKLLSMIWHLHHLVAGPAAT